ncbi:ABC transporter permease [Pseudomonas putida]|uniref:ABC transporter permease n=1 Tax=Pseudomonas putida TaxID=303 RepID=UPI00216A07A7|nr:ABC transporter permease [Pseudomonas putida]MCS4065610.1 capsular polysaccharide transport system permease protein [Pseudomonas putida]
MSSKKKFKGRALFALIFGLPMALSCIYYTVFSVDRYVSATQVVVREESSSPSSQVSGLSVLLTGASPASREETLYLREYVTSMDMMLLLEERLQWIEKYSTQRRDIFFTLDKSDPREDILKYYQRMVTAHFDETTGLLKISVEAFDQKLAQEMLKIILSASEHFVNEVSHGIAREQMKFSQGELEKSRAQYNERKNELIAFQAQNKVLDGQTTAQGRASIIAALEGEYSTQQAALTEMLYKLRADSPQVRQQRQKIASLGEQLAAEKKRLVSSPQGDQLNVIASKYQQLALDAGIAEESYKAAVVALENARIESYKKIRTLVTVVTPNSPDKAIYPERWYNLLTIAVALLMLYGIARFLIASIEDHRD